MPTIEILLTLRKIRLNESFALLGINMGMSGSTASRIFSKIIPILAKLMGRLVIWPQRQKIRMHLPIPFRMRYNKVVSIVDCLEIEI